MPQAPHLASRQVPCSVGAMSIGSSCLAPHNGHGTSTHTSESAIGWDPSGAVAPPAPAGRSRRRGEIRYRTGGRSQAHFFAVTVSGTAAARTAQSRLSCFAVPVAVTGYGIGLRLAGVTTFTLTAFW